MRWDNIIPANVNLLPMQVVVDEETVNRCVEKLQARALYKMSLWQLSFDDSVAREIVLSVLSELAAGDIGVGHEENRQSETGQTGSGGSVSGPDNV